MTINGTLHVRDNITGSAGNLTLNSNAKLYVGGYIDDQVTTTVNDNAYLEVQGDFLANNGSLTIKSGATVIIHGNLPAVTTLDVQDGGTLIVYGDVTSTNSGVNISGNVIVLGNYYTSSSTNIQLSGNLVVQNDFTFAAGGFSPSTPSNQLYLFGSNNTVPSGSSLLSYAGDESALQTNDPALYALYSTLVSPECPNSEVSYNVTANSTYNGGTADHAGDQFVWTVTGGVIETISNGTDNVVTVGSTSGLITLGANPSTTTVTAKVLWTDTGLNTITVQQIASTGCDGNVSTMNVEVGDNEAPVPDVASLLDITGECSATITSPPTATDNCAGTITGTTTDPLTYSTQGTYSVTWTYDDGHGNTTTQTQNVVIDDVTAPVFNIPTASNGGLDWSPCADDITQAQWDQANDDITPTPPQYATFYQGDTYLDLQLAWLSDNCTAADQLVISWSIQFADNTTMSGTGQLSAHSGNIQFPIGDNTITYTITDKSNNQASYNYDVAVKPRPVITKTTN
jgi:formylmethanofuran dehydrogenase subunit C